MRLPSLKNRYLAKKGSHTIKRDSAMVQGLRQLVTGEIRVCCRKWPEKRGERQWS